jgi:hypothetical protein
MSLLANVEARLGFAHPGAQLPELTKLMISLLEAELDAYKQVVEARIAKLEDLVALEYTPRSSAAGPQPVVPAQASEPEEAAPAPKVPQSAPMHVPV